MDIGFKPIRDRIIVTRNQKTEKTTGGLLLTEMSMKQSETGIVISVGDGPLDENGNRITMDTKVGDNIMFPMNIGTDIMLNGEEYIIMVEKEIYGVFTGENNDS